jgi:hypothetical protein
VHLLHQTHPRNRHSITRLLCDNLELSVLIARFQSLAAFFLPLDSDSIQAALSATSATLI